MNMKAQQPLPNAQVKIDLSKADTIKCDACGNILFIQAYAMKRISAIISPTGKEELITVPLFSCGNCGELAPGMSGMINNKEE